MCAVHHVVILYMYVATSVCVLYIISIDTYHDHHVNCMLTTRMKLSIVARYYIMPGADLGFAEGRG